MLRDEIERLFELDDFPEDAFDIKETFEGKNIVLYGAGESSIWFFEIVRDLFGYSPNLILDKKFVEPTQFENVDAISPKGYKPSPEELKNTVVVVCSGSIQSSRQIISYLKELGFNAILSLRDIYQIHNPFQQPDRLKTEGFSFFKEQKENILSAFDLLADEESKQVYFSYLKSHMLQKPVLIPNRNREEQYFPRDIAIPQGYSCFVSCGSYDGDTVRLLNQFHGKVEDLVCFEAEPAIYKRLIKYINSDKDRIADRIITFPFAAYDDEKIVRFTSATGLGSRISENGTINIQSVALDHVLPNLKPTMITMDIEGAEPYALKGAEAMIKKHKPALGICVYHSPEHLWEIPLYLSKLNKSYRFYLRNYTSFCIETVLYAI